MPREPLLMCAVGKKGVGKSWQHMILMNSYVAGDPNRDNPLQGRKCLIMDVNDEYGQFYVPAISLSDVALYTIHPTIEIRRIRPFHPHGGRMNLDEWAQALFYVLGVFRNGLLLIEDPNKFISDHMPADLIGAIATNRHVGLDVLMSFQSIGRINTKIWGNMNVLRYHKNIESVERHKMKFPDKYEYMRIAEIMVNDEYNSGNKRFFVYVDMDEEKIRGQYSMEIAEKAIDQYIYENFAELTKPFMVQKAVGGKKAHTQDSAMAEVKKRLISSYITS